MPNFLGSETFSFLGVSFATPVITRVRITNGNTALGAGATDQNGGSRDVVVMDDFIYGEPTTAVAAVPEPASIVLTATGLLMLLGITRRSRAGRATPDAGFGERRVGHAG